MNQSFDIAVVGATGTVGETIVQILEERDFPVGELHLLASLESAGSSVPYRGKNVRVREVDAFDFTQVRMVFFAAGPAVTLSFADKARAAGVPSSTCRGPWRRLRRLRSCRRPMRRSCKVYPNPYKSVAQALRRQRWRWCWPLCVGCWTFSG